jgi:integrase
MRGHVAKKGKRYYAVVYEGVDPATGKDCHRWYAGGRTRKEAERVLTELIKRQHAGDYRAPERITVETYLLERWLPMKRSQLRPSTFDSYERNLKNHVIPRIGSLQLQRLTPEDLDGLYADLLTGGRRNGSRGRLGPKTVRYVHGIVRKALADAHRKGTVSRNVADLADPPKASAWRRPETLVWTAPQLRQFLEEISEHRLYSAFFLAANTGMRRGEVLGLRWKDIDFDTARLSVQQALVNVAYRLELADVKTHSGRRTIDLDERTIAVLGEHRQRQHQEQLLVGRQGKAETLVFSHPDGSPVHPDYVSQVFDRHLARSALPRIRFHDLRHTHATILLQAGVPVKVVSERLGHANPAFTMTVYQHVLPGMQADAAAMFSATVFGKT